MASNHSSSSGSAVAASSSAASSVNNPPPPSSQASLVARGRNREQQQLNNEIHLLEEELRSLDNVALASKACEDFVTFVESRADPFFPNSDGAVPLSWPYDRPVKASRCCWKF